MKSKTNTNPLLSFRVKQNPKKEIPNLDSEILTTSVTLSRSTHGCRCGINKKWYKTLSWYLV